MQAPENDWQELTPERRAAINARDLGNWTPKQLRAEIRRREPFQERESVGYWVQRLRDREAALGLEHELRSLPQHAGLRVVPDKETAENWLYRIVHVPTGADLIGVPFVFDRAPIGPSAHATRSRLLKVGDWMLTPDDWTSEMRSALEIECQAARETIGGSWPKVPDSPEGL